MKAKGKFFSNSRILTDIYRKDARAGKRSMHTNNTIG